MYRCTHWAARVQARTIGLNTFRSTRDRSGCIFRGLLAIT